jgi:hypothetical protein
VRLSDFDDWAQAHHGIITLEASGLPRSSWHRAIAEGDLQQIHPHVARLIGTPDTPEQRIIAASWPSASRRSPRTDRRPASGACPGRMTTRWT